MPAAPTSSVTALPLKRRPGFTLKWSGQDDTGGSGIGSYTIYESEDSGPYTWLTTTSQTSMPFTAQVGHTYSFYSVATDNVGNIQPTPTAAQASTTIVSEASLSDFTGVGHSEPTVYRPSTAAWYVQTPGGTTQTLPTFGWLGHDIPGARPGDYDGVGHTEQAVYRPSTSQWFVLEPNGKTETLPTFGWAGHDVPVPGDYDGVGHTEQAVYRPSTGQWFVLEPNGTTETFATFGWIGHDLPMPGDYDGIGHTEAAVYRPSPTAQWFVLEPNGTSKQLQAFGWANYHDIPAPGDYDGVGHVEQAVYRPSTGQWFVLEPNGKTESLTTFGWSGHHLPVTAPLDSLLQLGYWRNQGEQPRRAVGPTALRAGFLVPDPSTRSGDGCDADCILSSCHTQESVSVGSSGLRVTLDREKPRHWPIRETFPSLGLVFLNRYRSELRHVFDWQ